MAGMISAVAMVAQAYYRDDSGWRDHGQQVVPLTDNAQMVSSSVILILIFLIYCVNRLDVARLLLMVVNAPDFEAGKRLRGHISRQ